MGAVGAAGCCPGIIEDDQPMYYGFVIVGQVLCVIKLYDRHDCAGTTLDV